MHGQPSPRLAVTGQKLCRLLCRLLCRMPCRMPCRRKNQILQRQLKIKRGSHPRSSRVRIPGRIWARHLTAAGQPLASRQLGSGKNILFRRQTGRRMAHKTHTAAPATPKPAA